MNEGGIPLTDVRNKPDYDGMTETHLDNQTPAAIARDYLAGMTDKFFPTRPDCLDAMFRSVNVQ
jgi:hypothetical protein